jgi:broad specificity phosphatase PhoE
VAAIKAFCRNYLPQMAVIYHVEHGDTRYDAEGKAQGLLSVGLNEEGKRQAREAGRRLKGTKIDCIYTSPMTRAKQTADIICGILGGDTKVIVRPNLRPLDIGELAGKSNSTVRKYLEFYFTRPSLSFPNGEKVKDWYAMIRKEWIHQFADDDPEIAVVSHARDWQLLNHWQKNGLDAGPEGVSFEEPKSAQVAKVTKSGNSIRMRQIA